MYRCLLRIRHVSFQVTFQVGNCHYYVQDFVMFKTVPSNVGVGMLRVTLRNGVRRDLSAFHNRHRLARRLPQLGP